MTVENMPDSLKPQIIVLLTSDPIYPSSKRVLDTFAPADMTELFVVFEQSPSLDLLRVLCRSAAAGWCLAATGTALSSMLSGALRDANLRSEREKGGLLPATQGRPNHDCPAGLYVASPDACEGAGTDWVAAAFDFTVVTCCTETRDRSPLFLASARAAGHAATLAESRQTSAFLNREAAIQELLWMNDDAPWKRSFQFHPFAVDVFGPYGAGATTILQQLARKRSEHNSMTMGACKRLAFQTLSVALQTATARMLRSKKASISPRSLLAQLPGSAS
jgi:hypothetical protein